MIYHLQSHNLAKWCHVKSLEEAEQVLENFKEKQIERTESAILF